MIKPFDNLSQKNINKLLFLLRADKLSFNKDTNISKTIIDKNTICIITKGCIQIIRNNYNGNDTIIETLKENDVLTSSISYIKSSEYNLYIKEDTELIIIDENILLNYPENSKGYYNQFIKNLFIILNDRMREKNERIQILIKKSIRDKLLEYFYLSRSKTGSNNIYLPFNYTILADYLGINRSALMREIKNLKNEGFIETKGNKIKLLY